MLKPIPSDPDLVSLSAAVYRVLLAFYPARFKRDFGPHMAQVFRDSCLKTYLQSGPRGMLSLWALTLFDWFKTVIEEQMNRGTEMTRSKFIRLSGWAMILAAVILLLSFLPEADQILDGLYQTFGLPATPAQHGLFQTITTGMRSLVFPAVILFITLGLCGLYIRYAERTANSAKISLGMGIAGGVVSLVISAGMVMGIHNVRPLMNISMAFMFAGLFVFGLATLRSRPMPRGNGLPALAGFWWPFLVIQAYVYPLFIQRLVGSQVPLWFSFTIFSIMSISLATLGYVLQADIPRVKEPTPHQGIRL
jgi:hypothetical protein